MDYIDAISADPESNLSLDDALLDDCEVSGREYLRVWEPSRPSVVAGRSNRRFEDVDLSACRRLGIPVLRRRSGGGTVLLGPGCLTYSVVLSRGGSGELSTIRRTNQYVMTRLQRVAAGLTSVDPEIAGFTDLAIGGRKFSGNAQYRRRNAILFHGTFLLNMDLDLIESTLLVPQRVPEYRRGRGHSDFLMNIGESPDKVTAALINEWGAAAIDRHEFSRLLAGRGRRLRFESGLEIE